MALGCSCCSGDSRETWKVSEVVLPQKQHIPVPLNLLQSLCFIPLCPCLRTTFPWEACATTKSWFCPKADVSG